MKTRKIPAMMSAVAMAAVVAAALTACGGGGGGGSDPASGGTAAAPAASVDATPAAVVGAAFNRKAGSRSMLIQGSTRFISDISAFVQDANGLVIDLNGTSLTGKVSGSELAGNADYALGRWTAGNANFSFVLNGASTVGLDGKPDSSVHYLVYNPPGALPQAAALNCGDGRFTAATQRRSAAQAGPDSNILGTTTASGIYDYGPEGGKFTLDIRTVADGESGRIALAGSLDAPGRTLLVEDADPSKGNAYVGLAEISGEPGVVRLAAQYQLAMPSGKRYQGVLMLVCK